MIISRTPYRLPLSGGGTDLDFYYKKSGGHFTSIAIDEYVYVLLMPRSIDKNYLIQTTRSEFQKNLKKIDHDLIRETLIYYKIKEKLHIGTYSTVPTRTGLGTSSAMIVITVKFTLPVDGTYKLYIENPDGNAVQTGAVLTVSDAPAWQTAAGSLGSFSGGLSIGTITLTATNSTGMTVQSGSLPGGITLNSGSGSSTLTGTESGATSDTTYSFTIRATDAEGQTADRAFTITITVGANNSGQFN